MSVNTGVSIARSQAHTRPAVDQAGLADTPLFGTASLL